MMGQSELLPELLLLQVVHRDIRVLHLYLELLDGRVCTHTGKVAHTYSITNKGREYLRGKGIVIQSRRVEVVASVDGRSALSGIKSLLGNG